MTQITYVASFVDQQTIRGLRIGILYDSDWWSEIARLICAFIAVHTRRQAIEELHNLGASARQIGDLLGMSEASVNLNRRRLKEKGERR